MEARNIPTNPRLELLRREVEQTVLKSFRSHGWWEEIARETDRHDCIEVAAERGAVTTRIAVLYSSSGISNATYRQLSNSVVHIFFNGQPYMLDTFATRAARSRASMKRRSNSSARHEFYARRSRENPRVSTMNIGATAPRICSHPSMRIGRGDT